MALLCLASPIVFAPSALHEEQTGLWVRAGLPKTVVQKLVLPGGTTSLRYALVARDGVYQTSDGPGTAWQAVDRDLPSRRWNNVEVQTLAADSSNPSVVYVGMGGAGSRDPARSAGLYVTTDGGQTWQSPVKSIAGEEVQIIAVMPRAPGLAAAGNRGVTQSIQPDSVVCAATVGAIYCNTGVGQSWVRLDWRGTERVLSMAIRPGDPSAVYIGTAGFGLVTTIDGGITWKQSHADLQDRQVYDIVMPVSRPDVLYVATDDGLFESPDAGLTWTRLGGPTEGRRANTIALCPETFASGKIGAPLTRASEDETMLCVGLQHGAAYRSADGGRSWVALNKGLGSMTVLSLAVDPQDPSVLWAGTTDGVWRYSLPVAQGEATTSPSPSAKLRPSPTMTPTAASVSLPLPEPTVALTWTAQPGATPSSTATAAPTPTATSTLQPTVTRTVPASPTRTRTPSPSPTGTEAPLPPPEPPRPRATPTRVPR
jgi:photosystem II stability/assembly factor-like uncharacterized protein